MHQAISNFHVLHDTLTFPCKDLASANCTCASHWCSYVDMGRRPSLSSNERAHALGMRVVPILEVSYSTMSRLMIRFNATNSVKDRRRSGRPEATMHSQDNLIRTLTLRNHTITARTLQGQLRTAAGVTVSDQTIRNCLLAAGLRARRPVVHIPLKQLHRIHPLDWCRCHLQWNGLQWSRVTFSDESCFNLYFNEGGMRVYRRRGERYSDVNVKEHDRYGGGSVMVWAAVTMHRRTPLQFIAGNLSSQRYVDEVMRPMVLPFLRKIGQGAVFQDDNARLHRGHCQECVNARGGHTLYLL